MDWSGQISKLRDEKFNDGNKIFEVCRCTHDFFRSLELSFMKWRTENKSDYYNREYFLENVIMEYEVSESYAYDGTVYLIQIQ